MTGQLQKRNRRMVTDILELGGRQRGAPVRTERELLTNSWTRDVETVSAAIAGFDTTNRRHAGECKVMLFEIAGDSQLHVNVIHTHERTDVRRDFIVPCGRSALLHRRDQLGARARRLRVAQRANCNDDDDQ